MECTCTYYVVDYSDLERYHPENVDREDNPQCPVHGEWKPGRWWRVLDTDGELWAETSSEDEAREAQSERPGSTLQRLWERHDAEWRDA